MKKSVKVRVLCLIVATVMLGGAVAAAAVLGSPYEILKKALLDAVTSRNVTEESIFTMTVNGVLYEKSINHNVLGDDSSLQYYFDGNGDVNGYNYSSKNLTLTSPGSVTASGVKWLYASVKDNDYYSFYRPDGIALFEPEDRNSAQFRFLELLLDVIVGDLKNNITMTSENEIRYISGTLTESQVPELVKAGIDVLLEESVSYYGDTRDVSFDGNEYIYEQIYIEHDVKTVTVWKENVRSMASDDLESWRNGTFYDNTDKVYWGTTYINGATYLSEGPAERVDEYSVPVTRDDYPDNGDPLEIPMRSIVVDYVHGEAEIDRNGNLLYLDAGATFIATDIFGVVNVVEFKVNLRFSDIGTSNPACPVPGAEQLLTAEYMKKHFGDPRMQVYFTLNEDGSINAGSVTDSIYTRDRSDDIDDMTGTNATVDVESAGYEE